MDKALQFWWTETNEGLLLEIHVGFEEFSQAEAQGINPFERPYILVFGFADKNLDRYQWETNYRIQMHTGLLLRHRCGKGTNKYLPKIKD